VKTAESKTRLEGRVTPFLISILGCSVAHNEKKRHTHEETKNSMKAGCGESETIQGAAEAFKKKEGRGACVPMIYNTLWQLEG
jgi:hypothetical protein